ncbi:MAG: hypothetical protein ACI865_000568 [Flavobacteriaceae bacterium]|jgi:hypothetical protein
MHKTLLFIAVFAIPGIGISQYCNTGGPSSTADSNIESLSLVGASGSISYTGCPGVIGVEEYLAQTAFLDAGLNYTTNIQFGTCGGNFTGVGEAWIDYNQNFIFEASESIGTWSGNPPVSMSSFNFIVPAGAVGGQTRMRVIQQESGTIPIDPCAIFTWGSATDFSVFIQNGIDCSAYIGDDFSDPRMVSTVPFTESHDNTICYSNQNTVYNSPDVYYLVTPLTGINILEVSLCGSSFDTFLTATDVSGNPLAINDDHPTCGTQSQLSVDVNGLDSIYIIVEGWGFAMGPYEITINEGILGLNRLGKNNLSVYPNPSENTFQVGNDFRGTIKLIDGNGRQFLTKTIQPNEVIETGNLPRGFYMVHLISEGQQRFIQKLILK